MPPHAPPAPPRPARRSRAGHTLAELITVLAVLGVVLGVTVPSAAQVLDTAAVLVARQEATALLALARGHALAAGRATAVTVQATEARLVAHAGADTLRHASWRPLGVALEATRCPGSPTGGKGHSSQCCSSSGSSGRSGRSGRSGGGLGGRSGGVVGSAIIIESQNPRPLFHHFPRQARRLARQLSCTLVRADGQ